KGRDLFDLWTAFTTTKALPERVIGCFLRYMENEGRRVSRAEFERNLLAKIDDPGFLEDVGPLLIDTRAYDVHQAVDFVMKQLAPLIPGEPWQGKSRG
ncbi:MAG: nucleotidyl transferase AbiEii/AbiGii toxin family protein, partial [Thermodesulfobacteriota bacterium]